MSDENSGSCNCGGVRLRTRGALRDVIACHCSQCRKQTGLYYAATNVLDSELDIDGVDNVTWYRSSAQAQRGFCRTCGSALFWKMDGEDYTSIMAGIFDEPTGLTIGYHIFCSDKGDFYEINDSLPQFARSNA